MTDLVYEAFAVEPGREQGDKSRWTRIGAAFKNKAGLTVKLNALPTNGKLVLLPPRPKEEDGKKPGWRF
jgi:hypothetical protein